MTTLAQRVHLSCVGKRGWSDVVSTHDMTTEHRPGRKCGNPDWSNTMSCRQYKMKVDKEAAKSIEQ